MTQTRFRDKLGTPICIGDKIVKGWGSRASGISFYEVVGETAHSLKLRKPRGGKPFAYRDFLSMLVVKDPRVDKLFEKQ
jgi:hypothetical protein